MDGARRATVLVPGQSTATELPAPLVARPRLEAALDGVLAHRLALVVGDAGSGKTTLVRNWARGLNAVVCDVTPADIELPRFSKQLVDGLRPLVSVLPEDLPSSVEADRASGARRTQPDALAELLGSILSHHLVRDTVLVVDNVHLLDEGPASSFLEALVRHAPPLLHLVLASRTVPPIAVDRLRTQGEVVELYGSDLAFTVGEVQELLDVVLEQGSATIARAVHEGTAGWPAAVRLSVEAMKTIDPQDRAARVADLVDRAAVSRLTAAVYEQEPRDVRRLLATVALFDEACPALLEAVGVAEAGSLADLMRRGLFLEPGASGTGWYRLHVLAQDAIAAADDLTEKEAVSARSAGAVWLEEHEQTDAALRTLVAARRHDEVVALLLRQGPRLLALGSFDDVIDAVTALPDRSRSPELEGIAGEAFQLRGDWDEALAHYERALPDEGPPHPGLAWRTGLIHYLRGDPAAALSVYSQAPTAGEPSRDRALLLAWTATAHWGLGDAERCGQTAIEALRVADAVGDPQALAAAHTILGMLAALEGDPRGNDAHYLKALAHAETAGDVFQVVRILANRGSHFMEQGAYADALEQLDRAISLADLSGLAGFGALALSNRGEALLGLGRLEEARSDLEDSARILGEQGSGMKAYPLRVLGDVHHLRGDTTAALQAFEEALGLSEAAGDAQGRVPALAGLARLLAEEDPDRAAELAEEAVAAGPGMGRVAALLASGWVALAAGDHDTARRRAAEAAREAEARRDRPGLADATTLEASAAAEAPRALALADQATALWLELEDPIGLARAALVLAEHLDPAAALATFERVRARMRLVGCRLLERRAAAALVVRGPERLSGVRVETLGGFRAARDGRPIPTSAWKSRKARDLLKLLVSQRGRAVTREALMEVFWPQADPADAANRLNVLLSTIRSVLDPDRTLGAEGVIAADGDTVRLDLDGIEVDVDEFLADAALGLRLVSEHREVEAREYLVRAETCYRGDFAVENVYEDWGAPLREEARATYREVVGHLARWARANGDHDAAIRYLLRSLEHDPYDERSHLELIGVLGDSGRHGDARRYYRSYCARMEELGVEASPFESAPDGQARGR